MTRLTGKKILCAIQECKKGRKASEIAAETAVSQRRIQRSYAEFCRTGTPHTPGLPGRKPVQTAKEKMLVVLWHCKKEKTGAHYAAQRLKDDGQNIICYEAYKIIQENGQITPSPASQKGASRCDMNASIPTQCGAQTGTCQKIYAQKIPI